MIDRAEFNTTINQWGNEIVVITIDIFFSESEERFRILHEDVKSRDFKQLELHAHSLKGNVSYFKDPVTIELSKKFVEMARKQTETGLEEVLENLQKNTLLLLDELKEIRKELTS